MKQSILLILLSLLLSNNSHSQVTKDNWMIGGNANFSFNNASAGTVDTKTTTLNLSPNIGYFFVDKFAGGVRLSYYRNHIKFGEPNNNFIKFTNYTVGPFLRYYFLQADKQYNLISEISYQFGKEKDQTNNSTTNSSSNRVSFFAGPVIYFNTSVGIEFLFSYFSSGNNISTGRANSFGVGIGLQVHLQKDKN